MTLDELPIGRCATIIKVGGEDRLKLRLLDMGLIPRTVVTLQKIAPMGDPIEIRVRGYELTLRKDDAKNIEIGEISNETPIEPETNQGKKAKKRFRGGKSS